MIRVEFLFSFSLFYLFLTGVQGGGYATYNSHVEQHEQSVQAGKKIVAERLGSTSGLGSSSSSSSNYIDCALCKSGSYYQGNRGYDVGNGYIGLNGGSSQQLSSSSSLSSSSHLNNQVHIPVVTGSSGNYQHETQRVIESQSQLNPTILVSPSSGHSQSYHQESQKIIESKANPTLLIAPSSGHSQSYHQESQKIIESKANPTLIVAANPASYHHESEKLVELQKSVPPTFSYYSPSSSSGKYHHESERVSSSHLNSNPVYVSPNIGSNYHHESENLLQLKQSVVPTITYTPSGGVSESHHESSKIVSSQQATPVLVQTPTSNLNVYGSSNQHKYVSSYPSTIHYTPYGGGSLSESEFNSKYVQNNHGGTSGLTLLPSYSSGLSLGGLSSSSGLSLGGLSSSSSLNSDFYHSGSSHHNSLDQYMNESERLARLQAQSINAGGVRTGGSVLNSEYGSSNHLGLGSSANLALGSSANLGTGGYRKSQAWEKSSKWASGTEFGPDGQPKNYNLLSTAESEQHNLNGKQAGYKAATTTLDDNGKVSTYSIHTP